MARSKDRCATVSGIFLKPSVSKNGRLYNAQNITAAVKRMTDKLASGADMPLTMNTSHAAANKDDALTTIGRITKVSLSPDFTATFEADIADTVAGKDIAALVTPKNPYIRGVSIRGAWLGEMRGVTVEGVEAITADDLEINGVDFTSRPGVDGAIITSALLSESILADDPALIYESVDDAEFFEDTIEDDAAVSEGDDGESDLLEAARAFVELSEAKNPTPYGDVAYADNGFQADGKKRYPIDTKEHVKSAWAYVNVAENATKYTPAQLKRVKSRIKSAAKKFGINVVGESKQFRDEMQELLEAYASVSVSTDAANVNVSGHTDDPKAVAALADALATAAQAALAALDTDNDGDIDLSGWPEEAIAYLVGDGTVPDDGDDDNDMSPSTDNDNDAALFCTHCSDGTPLPNSALYCPTCGQPVPQAESVSTADDATESIEHTQENPDMPTDTETAAAEAAVEAEDAALVAAEAAEAAVEAAPERKITDADATAIGEAFAKAMAPAAAPAPVAPVAPAAAEAAPAAEADPVIEAATFTAAQVQEMVTKAATDAVAEAQKAAVADYRSGGATRKGLVGGRIVRTAEDIGEGGELDPRALGEMDQQEFRRVAGAAILEDPFFANLNAKVNARAAGSY